MKRLIRKLLGIFGYEISRKRKHVEWGIVGYLNFQNIVEFYIAQHPNPADIQVVQVGANDGRMHDPVYSLITDNGLKACLIEPQPNVFERLKENYAGFDGAEFVNAVISDKQGKASFYSLSDSLQVPGKDFNFSGISSLSREHVVRGFQKYARRYGIKARLEDCLRKIEVDSMPLSILLENKNIDKIDILQIDAEGFDYEVLKTIDFSKTKPFIIHFEHSSLSDSDKSECWKMLAAQGYSCAIDGTDSVCLLTDRGGQ